MLFTRLFHYCFFRLPVKDDAFVNLPSDIIRTSEKGFALTTWDGAPDFWSGGRGFDHRARFLLFGSVSV